MDRPPSEPRAEARGDPTAGQGETAAPALALRVLTGTYEGSEYPLSAGREIVVGRSRDVDLVLLGDDRVSRRHARIAARGGAVVVQDLGSTNGTFVNGQRITEVEISGADRVEVGGTAMHIVTTSRRPSTEQGARRNMEQLAELRVTRARSIMHGVLEEVSLAELLQLLCPSRRTGVIRVERGGMAGRVHLRDGQVRHAAIDGDWATAPLEALFELLGWSSGSFDVASDDGEIFAEEITLPLEALLMEAMTRLGVPMDDEATEPTVEVTISGEAPTSPPPLPCGRPLAPRPARAEDLALTPIPWRMAMSGPVDRASAFEAAAALNGHSDEDWATLRAVAATTLTWADRLVEGFGAVHGDPCRCAVLFDEGREPVGDDELRAWRDLVESWLAGILPGDGGEAFFRESWVAGLVHLSRGVRNVYLLSWMARLQQLFRARCFATFEVDRALAVSEAFDRVTDTAVALACEAHEAGIMESVSKVGINESLLRKIQGQAVRRLIDAERRPGPEVNRGS